MKIAVNTRLLIKGRLEGMGWFTFHTMQLITMQHPEHHFYFLFDRAPHPDFIFSGNVTPVVLFPQARHPVLWYMWFEWSVTRFLKKYKPDVFVSPDGYLPLKTRIPSLSVIHDINFHHLSNNLPWMVQSYYRYFFPRFARKANHIATVSNYSKQDLVQTYKLSPNKIDVVFNGSDPVFQPLTPREKEAVRNQYCSGCRYFVFIGSLHPRKNMCRTLEAFDLFKKKTGMQHKLVMIGATFFKTKRMRKVHAAMSYKDDVLFMGRLQRPEVSKILGASTGLLYTPLFEGFGMPILEGFHCEVPVIASNCTSLPEVGGDAALYVDPYSPESIAEGLNRIVNDTDLKKRLVEKGRIRRDLFTWEKTSDLLYKSIHKITENVAHHTP